MKRNIGEALKNKKRGQTQEKLVGKKKTRYYRNDAIGT